MRKSFLIAEFLYTIEEFPVSQNIAVVTMNTVTMVSQIGGANTDRICSVLRRGLAQGTFHLREVLISGVYWITNTHHIKIQWKKSDDNICLPAKKFQQIIYAYCD